MSLSRKFSMALESSDLEGAVTTPSTEPVEETPELNPVEEEQLTQDISKDEQAIEECSGCLDETLDEQSNLVNQLETNEGILSDPKTEDIIQSEVALEHALARLGTSREEQGMHYFTTKSIQLSHEGIKDFLANVGKAIKELFRKVIMFFKKMFAKLRIKLGGYSKKLDKLNEEMKKLLASDTINQSDVANGVKTTLDGLNLASVSFYVGDMNSSPVPMVNPATVLKDIAGEYNDFRNVGKEVVTVEDKKGVFARFISKIKDRINKAFDNGASAASAEAKKAAEAARKAGILANVASAATDGKINSTDGIKAIGCCGNKFYGVAIEVDDSQEEVQNALSAISAEYIKTDYNLDLKKLVESFINNYKAVKTATDSTSAIFKDIDTVHDKFQNFADDIVKTANEEQGADVQRVINGLAKNVKSLAVDVPNFLIKAHVHTIRDYLVIGNAILKQCGGESK